MPQLRSPPATTKTLRNQINIFKKHPKYNNLKGKLFFQGLRRSTRLPNKTMADNSSEEYEEENNKVQYNPPLLVKLLL